ncbi:hypothetical protein VCUG_01044 [Vavraia culicis subsp. floridensis]|uniref:Uncharacterized protein n=1 Tax=Vavraia culicis (isolate floridensis) TaxID=948595 RepID=L2GVY3_VAVCU|nr:uncharacterized protein VCUG_01044 [Vavraia culicis subsp. floridensis]ELA47512.1 hypothetical protein VCUG_01044 [Vavraia culicis subsp. floridensis]
MAHRRNHSCACIAELHKTQEYNNMVSEGTQCAQEDIYNQYANSIVLTPCNISIKQSGKELLQQQRKKDETERIEMLGEDARSTNKMKKKVEEKSDQVVQNLPKGNLSRVEENMGQGARNAQNACEVTKKCITAPVNSVHSKFLDDSEPKAHTLDQPISQSKSLPNLGTQTDDSPKRLRKVWDGIKEFKLTISKKFNDFMETFKRGKKHLLNENTHIGDTDNSLKSQPNESIPDTPLSSCAPSAIDESTTSGCDHPSSSYQKNCSYCAPNPPPPASH